MAGDWSTPVVGALVGAASGPLVVAWSQSTPQARRDPAAAPANWCPPGLKLIGGVSMVLAVGFGMLGARYAGTSAVGAWWWLAATGVVQALVDAQHRRLPFRETAVMAVGGVLLLTLAAGLDDDWDRLLTAISAALLVAGVALALLLAFPRHTGGGDAAIYPALALYLGWFGWIGLLRGLLAATTLTAIVAAIVWVRHGRGATLPAGPPLIAGTLLAVLTANPHPVGPDG